VLTARGLPADLAQAAVLAGGIVDIGLGVAIMARPLCALGLRGTLLVGVTYLAGASVLAPALWLDPLGPMVKVLPAILLSLVGLAILEER
jgi:hypothetical protein